MGPMGLIFCTQSSSPAILCALRREARFWECALGRRGVALLIVCFVTSVAEGLSECPVVRVHGGFREHEYVRGVVV